MGIRHFKKTSVQAFILPIVLFFMQLFALLGLYGLQAARIGFIANRDAWQYKQYKNTALAALSAVESKLMTDKITCQIPVTAPVILSKKSLEWWESTSCSGNLAGNQYHYLLEFLGKDACAVIAPSNTESIAEYYRITLLLLPEKRINMKVILQSTVAIAVSKMPACQERTHFVKVGRQMWRQLG